jgi:peroxiredoxin
MRTLILRTAFLVLALHAAAVPSIAADTGMRIRIGETAPEFRLEDLLTGNTVSLSEFRGRKVVMVEFWGTWCDICEHEVPELMKLYADWKDKGFEFLAIAVLPGDADEVRAFIREKKIPYPTFLDEDLTVAARLYGLTGPIPIKVVIDHEGVVRYAHVGGYPPGDGELAQVIEDLVKEMKKGNGRTAKSPR